MSHELVQCVHYYVFTRQNASTFWVRIMSMYEYKQNIDITFLFKTLSLQIIVLSLTLKNDVFSVYYLCI